MAIQLASLLIFRLYANKMVLIAITSVKGSCTELHEHLSTATASLEVWDQDSHEFSADKELEQSGRRRADPAFLELYGPMFKLKVEQHILWFYYLSPPPF